MSSTVDDLLGRTPAQAEQQPFARDEVGCTGVFDHVEGVFVAHADDGGADLDALRPRRDGGQKRERRAELTGEKVDAEISAVCADLFGAWARSMDWRRTSRADRVADCGDGDQCPKDRKPTFFMLISSGRRDPIRVASAVAERHARSRPLTSRMKLGSGLKP